MLLRLLLRGKLSLGKGLRRWCNNQESRESGAWHYLHLGFPLYPKKHNSTSFGNLEGVVIFRSWKGRAMHPYSSRCRRALVTEKGRPIEERL
jgi:hypothetical protein